jgi:hypothetical protein
LALGARSCVCLEEAGKGVVVLVAAPVFESLELEKVNAKWDSQLARSVCPDPGAERLSAQVAPLDRDCQFRDIANPSRPASDILAVAGTGTELRRDEAGRHIASLESAWEVDGGAVLLLDPEGKDLLLERRLALSLVGDGRLESESLHERAVGARVRNNQRQPNSRRPRDLTGPTADVKVLAPSWDVVDFYRGSPKRAARYQRSPQQGPRRNWCTRRAEGQPGPSLREQPALV